MDQLVRGSPWFPDVCNETQALGEWKERTKYENWQIDQAQQVHRKRRMSDSFNDGSDNEVMEDVSGDSTDMVMGGLQE